jgi:succinate dehydrogenase / fumarate reductase, cytochrome b subunit
MYGLPHGYLFLTESQSMSTPAPSVAKKRPEFRNINAFKDLTTYRLPLAGIVSILHRISGAIMFLLMPFIIWMFDKSLSSEFSYAKFKAAFNIGIRYDIPKDSQTMDNMVSALWFYNGIPGWFMKLVALALIWAFLHHLIAGLRHLYMDINHAVTKEFGKTSAVVTLAVSISLTVILAAKLFGLY